MLAMQIAMLAVATFILGVASMGLVMSWAYDTRRLTPAPIYTDDDLGPAEVSPAVAPPALDPWGEPVPPTS